MYLYVFVGIFGFAIGGIAMFLGRRKIEKEECEEAYKRGVGAGRSVNVTQIVQRKIIKPELVKASVSFSRDELMTDPDCCMEYAKNRLKELFGEKAVEMADFMQQDRPEYCTTLITAALYMAEIGE